MGLVELTEKEQEARRRACLALDVPTVRDALSLSNLLSSYFKIFKVGKQLHIASGNEGIPIIERIHATNHDEEGNVFPDLKLYDKPSTVYEASKECAVPGVYMFSLHVAGGEEMCKKALEGAYEGAEKRCIERPKVIGVTVLTSLDDKDLQTQYLRIGFDDLVRRRTELAREWGLDGIVCPANKAGGLEKEFGSDLLYVTPGIEWAGKKGDDQKQLSPPDLAVRGCKNSILVIGSAVTKAENPEATAYEILKAMAKEL